MGELTDSQKYSLKIINIICSSLSVFSIIVCLSLYIFVGKLKLTTLKIEILIWTLICILFECGSSAYIPISSDLLCLVQALLNTIFTYAHTILCSIIGYVAFIQVIKPFHLDRNKWRYRILFLLIAFIIPLILAFIIYITDTYGNLDLWCWIASDTSTGRKLVITYYAFNWVIFIINSYFILMLILTLRKHMIYSNNIVREYLQFSKHAIYFPIAQVLSMIPGTINKILILSNIVVPYYLNFFQILFSSIIGLVFSILFLTIPEVKEIFKLNINIIGNLTSNQKYSDKQESDQLVNKLSLKVVFD
jgi:hypothetical protein